VTLSPLLPQLPSLALTRHRRTHTHTHTHIRSHTHTHTHTFVHTHTHSSHKIHTPCCSHTFWHKCEFYTKLKLKHCSSLDWFSPRCAYRYTYRMSHNPNPCCYIWYFLMGLKEYRGPCTINNYFTFRILDATGRLTLFWFMQVLTSIREWIIEHHVWFNLFSVFTQYGSLHFCLPRFFFFSTTIRSKIWFHPVNLVYIATKSIISSYVYRM
jgi:hypothetical protein